MTFRVSAKSECSTFVQFFQLRDKVGARQVPLVLPKFLPITIQDDERGESKHIVLAREVQVLLFQFSGLRLRPGTARPREVQLEKHEIFQRKILEIRLRENILVQANAPATPVGTSKIEKQQFMAGFGLVLGFVVIVEPTGRGCGASRRLQDKAGCDSERNEKTLFHTVTFN